MTLGGFRCAAVPVLLFLAALAAPGVAAAAGKPSYYEVLGVPKDEARHSVSCYTDNTLLTNK